MLQTPSKHFRHCQGQCCGSHFRELKKQVFGLKHLNSLMWVRYPGWNKIGSGIRDGKKSDPGCSSRILIFYSSRIQGSKVKNICLRVKFREKTCCTYIRDKEPYLNLSASSLVVAQKPVPDPWGQQCFLASGIRHYLYGSGSFPDPSINQQKKNKKTLDFYNFLTSFLLFLFTRM